jgi:hypothetical protein
MILYFKVFIVKYRISIYSNTLSEQGNFMNKKIAQNISIHPKDISVVEKFHRKA